MSTPYEPTPHDPIPEIPGLGDVIRALAAEGDATELTGRQAALTMFRAVRDQPGSFPSPGLGTAPAQPRAAEQAPGQPLPARDLGPGRPGQRRPPQRRPPQRRRLAALAAAAAVVVACAGMTAAAYAQILPASLQDIAHHVLAPIGVPSASHVPAVIATSSRPSNPDVPSPSPTHLPSSATSCPCPTVTPSAHVTMRLRAAKARVAWGGRDTLTGHVAKKGSADAQVRVKLLEQLSTSPGTWKVIATGLTNAGGNVTFVAARITANATFLLAGSGDLASLASHQVTVTVTVNTGVTPRLTVRHPAADVLVVTAHPAAAGDPVALEQRQDGTWETVATRQLSRLLQATFTVTSAGTYRFLLPATPTHSAAVSRQLTIATPAGAAKTTVTPSPTPQPTPSTTSQATAPPRAKPTRHVF